MPILRMQHDYENLTCNNTKKNELQQLKKLNTNTKEVKILYYNNVKHFPSETKNICF